jgi:hypothetical protein
MFAPITQGIPAPNSSDFFQCPQVLLHHNAVILEARELVKHLVKAIPQALGARLSAGPVPPRSLLSGCQVLSCDLNA